MKFSIKIICFFLLIVILLTSFSTAFPLKGKKSTETLPKPGRCINGITNSADTYCSGDLAIKRFENGEMTAFEREQMKIEYELLNLKETVCDVEVEVKISIPTEYGEISEECVAINSTLVRCSFGTLYEDDKKSVIINLKYNHSIPTEEEYLVVEAEAKTPCIDFIGKNNLNIFPIPINEEKAKGFEWTPLIIVIVIFLIFIIIIIIFKWKWIYNKFNQYMQKYNNSY